MNSAQLWRAVRREFKNLYPAGTIHRVENTLERGMPDCVWCESCWTGWIELKGEGDKETPIQRSFRNKWNRSGGNAAVLSFKDGRFVVVELNLVYEFEVLAEAILCIVGR